MIKTNKICEYERLSKLNKKIIITIKNLEMTVDERHRLMNDICDLLEGFLAYQREYGNGLRRKMFGSSE